MHPARIEISLSQFRKNIRLLKKFISPSLYCLPLKANAYGHGLCRMGREAEKAGVDYFAVAHLHEGIRLREAGIQIPILIFGVVDEEGALLCVKHHLAFSISSKNQAERIQKKVKNGKCLVHLKIDTGMQRIGVCVQEAKDLFSFLKSQKCFQVIGVFSHLATADKREDLFAKEQISLFRKLMEDPLFSKEDLIRHLCNSGGTLFFPEARFDMVRPGLASFGYLPTTYPQELKGVAPCFSLFARVSFIKSIPKGTGIGYGHTYRLSKDSQIVTIPVGYGDGFLRCLSNQGSILLKGERFPIVGNICMDQFMVDVGKKKVDFQDEAVLLGKQGKEEISLQEIAELSGTIPYEILCLLNERIPRIYIERASTK